MDKLVKCRLLDNTEMCQWIKKYFEIHYGGQEYDPVARRGGAICDFTQQGTGMAPKNVPQPMNVKQNKSQPT